MIFFHSFVFMHVCPFHSPVENQGSSRNPKTDLPQVHVPGHLRVEAPQGTHLLSPLTRLTQCPPASQTGPRRGEAAGVVRRALGPTR